MTGDGPVTAVSFTFLRASILRRSAIAWLEAIEVIPAPWKGERVTLNWAGSPWDATSHPG